MRKITQHLFLLCLLLISYTSAKAINPPKREFRGAWIQAVNGQFIGMSTSELQKTLTTQLNALQQAGINAIIFQVRPEADALYMSYYEPWSRYLTGEQGTAPVPHWDPLQFMIDECHKRGMELHAWINPYRAKTKGTHELGLKHPYKKYPERFIHYDGMLIFNPALQENRDYICTIVSDIVKRYDIDGLHIDDYFYPYPVPGLEFDDEEDDTTTTIDGLLFGSDAVIYNLYGQRIVKVVVPGFYIVNGKKMYVSEKMILNND